MLERTIYSMSGYLFFLTELVFDEAGLVAFKPHYILWPIMWHPYVREEERTKRSDVLVNGLFPFCSFNAVTHKKP